jgi:hypothetical protein
LCVLIDRFIKDYARSDTSGSTGQSPWWELASSIQRTYLGKRVCGTLKNKVNCQIQLSSTLYDAIDIIYGNEHTTNPPIIIEPISPIPILVTSTGSAHSTLGHRTPSPALSDGTDDTDSPNPFNNGKKVKSKPNKMDGLLELLNDNLAMKQEDLDEKRREREERRKERERLEKSWAETQEEQKELTKAVTSLLQHLVEKL